MSLTRLKLLYNSKKYVRPSICLSAEMEWAKCEFLGCYSRLRSHSFCVGGSLDTSDLETSTLYIQVGNFNLPNFKN